MKSVAPAGLDRFVAARGTVESVVTRDRVVWLAQAPRRAQFPSEVIVSDFDGKVDGVRKKIVATTEGGAITGEERLREHTDQLYGAILSYEGKPGAYQIAYIDALKRELDDVTKEFEQLLAQDLPTLNESLKTKGQQPIPPPPAKVAVDDTIGGSADGSARP